MKSRVTIGNHSALRVPQSEQTEIRKFYREVLGCEITRESDEIDIFRMGKDFFMTVIYQESALPEADWTKSIWLEIKAVDVAAMKKKILDFGVNKINSADKAHLYFQAPGGQVFRLVGAHEDLSEFEG